MQITSLRLHGFKSFVEPTELPIGPGLTGVVGPNGCGKSNLLEALRWVMGETSYKSMRGGAMDDVIFAGTASASGRPGRPARNSADVTVIVDNSARLAPAAYNDQDTLEITRRIVRDQGSGYRLNGREVRARDIQVLFNDAATGARSPALVRQGQIAELVNARPDARRRILEDAAGTAGLHSRRHEAELRLKAAEANLARLSDIMGQLDTQLAALKRQSRQARRYRELSDDIRRAEALIALISFASAHEAVDAAEAALADQLRALGLATQAEAAATARAAECSAALPPLREDETIHAAIIARLTVEREMTSRQAQAIAERRRALDAQVHTIAGDLGRAEALTQEAAAEVARLAALLAEMPASDADAAREAAARAQLAEHEARAHEAEQALRAAQQATSTHRAETQAALRHLADLQLRHSACEAEYTAARARYAALAAEIRKTSETDDHAAHVDAAAARHGEATRALALQDAHVLESRTAESAAREAVRLGQLTLREHMAEQRALKGLLAPAKTGKAPPVLDAITVAPGFELALTAGLGDDLTASLDPTEPAHWAELPAATRPEGARGPASPHPALPELPCGALPLAEMVAAPAALSRRLQQIGIIDPSAAAALVPLLRPGQRLVTTGGDLWRWDGLRVAANAPTQAAQRLIAANRLTALSAAIAGLEAALRGHEARLDTATAARAAAEQAERAARAALAEVSAMLSKAREAQLADRLSREHLHQQAQASAEREARARHAFDELAAAIAVAQGQTAPAGLCDLEAVEAAAQAAADHARQALAEGRAALAAVVHERKSLHDRRQEIERSHRQWQERGRAATSQTSDMRQRLAAARAEAQTIDAEPAALAQTLAQLDAELARVTNLRRSAAAALADAEHRLAEADRGLKAAQATAGSAREARARAEALLEASRERRQAAAHAARETFGVAPDGLRALAGLAPDAALPDPHLVEAQLRAQMQERDRLGGVNLCAEDEAVQLSEQIQTMASERGDLDAAIAKLRAAVADLNTEGQRRLTEAFSTVDDHFRSLFATLFVGGEAKLTLIESPDDPLAGGLEIIARPPGKKPNVLSLLSGGEQALTALSLIFAVFLTNPSPICVLDEVDAPLDDANVDRFCTMMEAMAARTNTRFLVITHHPMTMARMHRLFGVTMIEKGVSQLVSVDLQAAERFIERPQA